MRIKNDYKDDKMVN